MVHPSVGTIGTLQIVDMIFKGNFDLYTPQWDFKEFRTIVHSTLSQWLRGFQLVTHGT